ncbi:MAG: Gfo/Idh/MocA family oxidoreductase [Candidatus Omnitrophica bacterium]|nr:Gfo/Idh/MocA family oxidoreductase [Candidatus Omnitrophota bacterium]
MINIGLIGCGYWGPNLLRNFMDCPDAQVFAVADLDEERLAYVREKHPDVHTTKDYQDLFNPGVDAIVIATQPRTHYRLAKEALLQGKHVLIEKPLAQSVIEAEELVRLATERNLKLMVGHTFEYNAAVRELKRQIKAGTVGKPYYLYSQRLNFGVVRKDVNALWNLAPHDVSILIHLLDAMPLSVSCRGFDFIQPGIQDIIFMVLQFPNNIVAHVQVSWLDPSKVRKMTVVGSEKMIIYNDMDEQKIQVYDKGIKIQNMNDSLGPYDDFEKYQLIKRAGDVHYPPLEFIEPLKEECRDFVESIVQDRPPLVDGQNGLRVVRVLETAQDSMDLHGVALDIRRFSSRTRQPSLTTKQS